MSKHVKNDSAAYLKSWLGSLHEKPDFLKTVLSDVKRCTSLITQRIEAIAQEMDKGEKADYSQFKPQNEGKEKHSAETVDVAAKQTSDPQEEEHHFRRGR